MFQKKKIRKLQQKLYDQVLDFEIIDLENIYKEEELLLYINNPEQRTIDLRRNGMSVTVRKLQENGILLKGLHNAIEFCCIFLFIFNIKLKIDK